MELDDSNIDKAIEELKACCAKLKSEISRDLEALSSSSEGRGAVTPAHLLSDFTFLQNNKMDPGWVRDVSPSTLAILAKIQLAKKRVPHKHDKKLTESLALLKCNAKRFEEIRSWKNTLEENTLSPAEQKKKADEKREVEMGKVEAKLQQYQSHFSYVSSEICGAPPPGFLKFNTLLKELLTPHFSKGESPWMEIKENWYQPYLAVLEHAGLLKRSEDSFSVMIVDLTDGHGNE